MQSLKDLLPLKKIAAAEPVFRPALIDEKTIFYVCKTVLVEEYGARGGENLIPTYLKEKKLFLSPRTSLWASEAHIRREHLVRRINELLGGPVLVEIKISQHY